MCRAPLPLCPVQPATGKTGTEKEKEELEKKRESDLAEANFLAALSRRLQGRGESCGEKGGERRNADGLKSGQQSSLKKPPAQIVKKKGAEEGGGKGPDYPEGSSL